MAQNLNESLFITIIWLKGEENLELCKSRPCSVALFPSAILWPKKFNSTLVKAIIPVGYAVKHQVIAHPTFIAYSFSMFRVTLCHCPGKCGIIISEGI